MGSDHFSLSVEILDNILPTQFFNLKIKLSKKELSNLHHILYSDPGSFRSCISSDLAADYENFSNLIKSKIDSIASHPIDLGPKTIKTRTLLHGGIRLNLHVSYDELIGRSDWLQDREFLETGERFYFTANQHDRKIRHTTNVISA